MYSPLPTGLNEILDQITLNNEQNESFYYCVMYKALLRNTRLTNVCKYSF